MSETNILAIVAIVMSAASLVWQAVSWLRSGPVIRASFDGSDDGTLTVRAYNSGREAATITSVTVIDNNSPIPIPVWSEHRLEPLPGSDPIPFRLPAGGHAQWHYKPAGTKAFWKEGDFRVGVGVGFKKYVRAEMERRMLYREY